ncbi:MAG: tRNA dihydrouridine synthase [Candidatus Borkfalkia sp.]
MQIRPVKIGDITVPNNLFAAPLAGYTDFAFRKLCYRFGAGLCFTEMVSAKGLKYNNEGTRALLYKSPEEKNTAAQLFGSDPEILRAACESEALAPFEIIDLNMGCPVPKIYKNGEGSALLNDLPRAEKIISACKKSGKTITVKFRIGVDEKHIVGTEFAKMCEAAGADLVTVHGRTRDKYSARAAGLCRDRARKAKRAYSRDRQRRRFCRADAERMIEKTGADGVMLARAILYDPHVFAEIRGESETWDIRAAILQQIEDMLPVCGEKFTVVQMRKMASFYIKGRRNCAQYKNRLFAADNLSALRALIDEIFA